MAIVLETLFALEKKQSVWSGTVRFIFQPAEETVEGALVMVRKGVVNDVDYLYGLHLRPEQELRTGEFAPGIQHGAARFLEGTISGEDAHGARPHLNKNAIDIGAEIIHMMKGIHLNPRIPYSVKVTSFHSGGKSSNIIPGTATFSLDLRAQTNEVMEELTVKVEAIMNAVSDLYDTPIDLVLKSEAAAAEWSEEAVEYMEKSIRGVVGDRACRQIIQTTGGDDFHFYTIKKPDLKATMLAIGCGLKPGLHHPKMTFDHKVMPVASDILVRAVLETLGNQNDSSDSHRN